MEHLFSFPRSSSSSSSPPSSSPWHTPSTSSSSAAADASPLLHLRLKLLDERTFDVHARTNMEVLAFRTQVAVVTDVPVARQRLIYRGRVLKDGTRLVQYAIEDGHTIHLVVRPDAEPAAIPTVGRPHIRPLLRSVSDGEASSRMQMANLGRSREMPGFIRPRMTMRRRIPEAGGMTGDAWNAAVLREALDQNQNQNQSQSQAAAEAFGPRPSRSPTPAPIAEAAEEEEAMALLPMLPPILPSVHQVMSDRGNEQRHMAEQDDRATATAASTAASTPETQPEARRNLDYLSQAIMTLQTILATAALPEENQDTTPSTATTTNTRSFRRSRRRFFVGQWLDVKDTVQQWLEATVTDLDELDGKILVHYHGWPSHWDEWIDANSDRIATFRTRTVHTLNGQHMSPMPTTRAPQAPPVGEEDIRRVIPQLRDVMRSIMPHIDRLAGLCEEDIAQDPDRQDEILSIRRREEMSETAHLVAPLCDRFGRLMMDTSQQLDPCLHPALRARERTQYLRRSSSSSASEDTALTIRDLVASSTRNVDQGPPRRSVDVHIHAIVTPRSVSSLATLARLGTAIAGAIRSRAEPSLPQVRLPIQVPPSDDATTPPVSEHNGSEAQHESRRQYELDTPLLNSLHTGEIDSNELRWGNDSANRSSSTRDEWMTSTQNQLLLPVTPEATTPRIGVIPEIAEAEERAQQRQRDGLVEPTDDPSRPPTFLEVMRRTLRNFGLGPETNESTLEASRGSEDQSDSVQSDSSILSPEFFSPSMRERSESDGSMSSIEDELDLVD